MPSLVLNWLVDGDIDEQRYYCSETPIDPENLAAPKVILTSNVRTCVDTDIEVGKTYYVRVGSVRNNVEKLSDELTVVAQDRTYRVQLNVTSLNLLNSYGTLPLTWQQSGGDLLHANNEIKHTSDASYLKSNEVFNWNGVWDIEFDAYIDSTVSNAYKSIVSNKYHEWVLGGAFIYYGDTGASSYEVGRFGIGNYGADGLMSDVMSKDTWHHVRCIKTADHKYTMHVDDVLQYSNAITNISNRNPSDGVITLGDVTSGISGAGVRIRNFIIH